MKSNEAFELINSHVPGAVKAGILFPGDCVSVRTGDGAWITRENADLTALREDDIFPLAVGAGSGTGDSVADLHASLYAAHPRIGAVINCGAPFIKTLSVTGETVRPYVDDIAQIIGIAIRCVGGDDRKKILRLLKRRNAVLIRNTGAVCVDTNLDDALAVAMIAEKACTIHVEASYLGGAKAINVIESALMRFVYVNVYSRQAEKR